MTAPTYSDDKARRLVLLSLLAAAAAFGAALAFILNAGAASEHRSHHARQRAADVARHRPVRRRSDSFDDRPD